LDINRGAGMQIQVNGEMRQVPEGATVATLLEQLNLPADRVAVERNRDLVPRRRHGETALAEGDTLEVVTLVGGG
jgi:thiamine biosynthesis protein ThiS